jgi:hypothetical protein
MDKDTNEIIETLNLILAKMATKEDIAELRAEMATKEELAELRLGMATKVNIAELHEQIRVGFLDLRSELKDIHQRLDALEAAVKNISGFAKEIDHLIERVGAIEAHLGIERKVAV